MISYIKYQEKTIEVLDRMVVFDEGEGLFLEINGKRISVKVHNIAKVLQCNGEKCDVVQEIYVG